MLACDAFRNAGKAQIFAIASIHGTFSPALGPSASLQPTDQRPFIVVDDNEDDLALTAILLRKAAGLSRLVPFTEGEDAVEFLSGVTPDSPDFPAAIILDVKMPGMNGLDLLEWIREHPIFDSIAVAMWSSSDDTRDIERAALLGAQCYVGKYPPVPVVEAMFAAAQRWQGIGKGEQFFDVRGNLFLGRGQLANLRAAGASSSPIPAAS